MLIAFIVMPIVEIAVLIQVGGWLGLWQTLALIILTAIAGTWMLRQQGFAVLSRAQTQLASGAVPLAEVFEGFCLVIAGALLLTPGFVTDVMGGLLLLPPLRAWLYQTLGGRLRDHIRYNETNFHKATPGSGQASGGDQARPGPVVEGDFDTVTTPEDATSDDDVDRSASSSKGAPSEKPTKPMPPPRGSWNDKT